MQDTSPAIIFKNSCSINKMQVEFQKAWSIANTNHLLPDYLYQDPTTQCIMCLHGTYVCSQFLGMRMSADDYIKKQFSNVNDQKFKTLKKIKITTNCSLNKTKTL